MRPNPIKRLLKEGKPAVGTWLTLGSVLAARFLARAGWDWLTVDTEHNAIGIETAANSFAAIADAGGVALARVPSNRHDHIKRVLDTGAHGVVVPMVNTRQEALEAVSACLYPPAGTRRSPGSTRCSLARTTWPRACAAPTASPRLRRFFDRLSPTSSLAAVGTRSRPASTRSARTMPGCGLRKGGSLSPSAANSK
jgi:2-keto-3-deoxy-L-rhamnonate aldolase RhmA